MDHASAEFVGATGDVARHYVARACAAPASRWLEAAAPYAAYWLLCAVFTLSGSDTRTDVAYAKNAVSRRRVVLSVSVSHVVGVFTNMLYMLLAETRDGAGYGVATLRWTHLLIGMFVLDTIEYWVHRAWHTPLLYERFHKEHHQLKCPYSYAALYNSWAENLVTGPLLGLGFYVAGLSGREFLIVTCAAYLSTAHQHTFTRRDAHHWRHHELAPHRNFAQPFLPYWDYLCGTAYEPRTPASTRASTTLQ